MFGLRLLFVRWKSRFKSDCLPFDPLFLSSSTGKVIESQGDKHFIEPISLLPVGPCPIVEDEVMVVEEATMLPTEMLTVDATETGTMDDTNGDVEVPGRQHRVYLLAMHF